MKKITVIGSILLLFATQTFAQTFAFFQDGVRLANNAEITITKAVPSEWEGEWVLDSRLTVQNLINDYVDGAHMRQTILSDFRMPFGVISFCLDGCSTVRTNELMNDSRRVLEQIRSFDPLQLLVSPAFKLTFEVYGNGYTGATVRYDIFPDGNENDKTTVTIVYDYNESSTGLNSIKTEDQVIIFQEDKNIILNYAFSTDNYQLEVYNLMGQKIAQHPLASHESRFILPEKLTSGLYLFAIKSGNNIVSSQKYRVQ